MSLLFSKVCRLWNVSQSSPFSPSRGITGRTCYQLTSSPLPLIPLHLTWFCSKLFQNVTCRAAVVFKAHRTHLPMQFRNELKGLTMDCTIGIEYYKVLSANHEPLAVTGPGGPVLFALYVNGIGRTRVGVLTRTGAQRWSVTMGLCTNYLLHRCTFAIAASLFSSLYFPFYSEGLNVKRTKCKKKNT